MNRKLQIFVSSTYQDLLAERQAAVEAILRAGHIPAGMELFAAGDKSQLETIYRWIDESDVYMLILGARYGSIDEDSGKSYTQLEYEYALAQGKRLFAVVLTDAAIDAKVKVEGRAVLENDHQTELREFKRVVTSKICRMVDDHKDIKLAIHETLLEFLRGYSFDGWVSGKHLVAFEETSQELARLTRENGELRAELRSLKTQTRASQSSKQPQEDFDALARLLAGQHETHEEEGQPPVRRSVLEWFVLMQRHFVLGISNKYNMSPAANFLFFRIGPHLNIHGLAEDQKVSGVRWRTLKTTRKGNEFLAHIQRELAHASDQVSGEVDLADATHSNEPAEVPPPRSVPRATAKKKRMKKVGRK